MSSNYNISACIVSFNEGDKLRCTVDSILSQSRNNNLTLFISDNGSVDGCIDFAQDYPDIKLIKNNKNLGFGRAHNIVLPLLDSDYHACINPDISISEDTLKKLCDYLELNPDVVMITPKILNEDGTEQHLPKKRPSFKYLLGGRIPFLRKWRQDYTRQNEIINKPTEIDFCTGCFFVIRTSVFKQLSGFNENYFMYFEDAELTLKAKQFGKVVFFPDATVTHLWERSSKKSFKYFFIHIISALKFFINN